MSPARILQLTWQEGNGSTSPQLCRDFKAWRQRKKTHRIADVDGLVIGHGVREPHYGSNGVQDEGEEHVLVKGDSLAAKTP